MAREFLFVTVVVSLGLFTCLGADAQPKTGVSRVEGRADVKEGGVSAARAAALEKAFEKKVREKTSEILPPSVLESDSAALDENIFSRGREFISRYSITEERREGDTYIIEAEVMVSEEALRGALLSNGFIREKDTGILFLMVAEYIDGESRTWWNSPPGEAGVPSVTEALFARVLKNQGYTLAEPIPSQPRPEVSKIMESPGSAETYAALTELYGADIFVFGRAKAVPVEEKASTRTIVSSARLDITISSLEEKAVIARFSGQARAEADTAANAGALAVEQAARSMVPEVLARLERYRPQAEISDKGKIVVSIGNLYSYKLYKTLSEILPGVPGVQEVELWGFAPAKVSFLVRYQGEPLALANALARKTFDDFKLSIVELDKNRIELRVEPVRYRGPRP